MTERLITLEAWAAARYADPPSIGTLRRWVRQAKIYPAPQKHGRSYWVNERARYVTNYRDIAKAERESAPAQH